MKDTILKEAQLIENEVISYRRHFHKHPELSYKEFETSDYIKQWLRKNDFEFKDGIAGTGIVAFLKGEKEGGRVVAVRAEMDCLPVSERAVNDFSSIYSGRMHACGHDAHMAMLMGVALLMKKIRNEFGGTIMLVFQPGEEKNPGGARLMIESGIFEKYKPDMFIAHHVLPELETGKVGYKPGRYLASCDEIYLTVEGKGGHAALPALTTDQIFIASNLVVRLKTVMSERQTAKKIPTVLGIGKIIGEGATNVIPEKVEIAGTFRTFDEKWRAEALDLIRLVADRTAREYGVKINVNISEGYPVLVNNEKMAQRAIELSHQLLGNDKVETYDIRMSSDDFSFYSSVAPSLYYRVGIRKKGAEMKKLHTPDFDIDEEGMKTGVGNMAWLLYNFLND
ncbi:MAG TPA: M20 family metallopeptidase [Bacteroidales bacterium]|nr:M20 family metallopeptidase [Bacteroidales bacterium]